MKLRMIKNDRLSRFEGEAMVDAIDGMLAHRRALGVLPSSRATLALSRARSKIARCVADAREREARSRINRRLRR